MKILSMKPMPDTTGITELFNDDGTLFGLAFEPEARHREVMAAWTTPNMTPGGPLQWGQFTTYNMPMCAQMAADALRVMNRG